MKKIILSLVVAIVATTATYAQSSLIATLSHEGAITTYYGATALSAAHEAAVDGDIITLSSGSFNTVTITKGITIRGAGMAIDPTTNSEPTVLTGSFGINIPEQTTQKLTIEGVYCNEKVTIGLKLTGATFLKSRFKEIACANNIIVKNLTMIHCKVANSMSTSSGSSVSLLNCIVWDPSIGGNWEFINCVIMKQTPSWSVFSGSTFKNSILIGVYDNYYFDISNTMYNCVVCYKGTFTDFFQNIPNTTNATAAYANVFKTCTDATYSDSETFELTNDATTTYLGTDGRQIGIYGGTMPFDPRTSNPRITNAVVGSKSDANGRLSINVTVEGAQ